MSEYGGARSFSKKYEVTRCAPEERPHDLWRCDECSHVFEDSGFPATCPECEGEIARMPFRAIQAYRRGK